MEAKRKREGAIPLFSCKICRSKPIPSAPTHLARHEAGKRHKKLQELLEKKTLLEAWGIVLVDGDVVKYVCVSCDLEMELSLKKMEKHFESVHNLPPPTSETPTFDVTKVYKRKKFCESDYDFEEDQVNFTLMEGPVYIQENTALSKNSIGILRKEVEALQSFSSNERKSTDFEFKMEHDCIKKLEGEHSSHVTNMGEEVGDEVWAGL